MTRVYRRGADYLHREIAGEHLLIALRRREAAPLHAMTPTAALIWDELAQWTTSEALASAVARRFAVTPAEALADVETFLGQLAEVQAVESREAEEAR